MVAAATASNWPLVWNAPSVSTGAVLRPTQVQGRTRGGFVVGAVGDAGCTASDRTGIA